MVTVAKEPPVPVTVVGLSVRVAGGGTGVKVIWDCALAPFQVAVIVAVSVTGVGEITCPACIMNCIQAMLPCIVTVGGTGNAAGFELVRAMAAPLAGAAPESCKKTMLESPLKSGLVASEIDTGVGGAALIVNASVAGHAVAAAGGGVGGP